MNYKFKSYYIKLSTTERHLSIQIRRDDISLVGYARFIDTKYLSHPFNVPDFLEDFSLMVKLKSYDDIMTLVHLNYLLLVVLLKMV